MIFFYNLKAEKINNFLESKGFSVTTVRKVLTSDFGYKNTKQINKAIGINIESFLKKKLCYKSFNDYKDICFYISKSMEFLLNLKDSSDISHWKGCMKHFDHYDYNTQSLSGNGENSLYKFNAFVIFNKLFKKTLDEQFNNISQS